MGVFSGRIISLEPAKTQVGGAINVKVTYEATTTSTVEKINGWWTDIRVKLGSFEGLAGLGPHYGSKMTGTVQIYLGQMPDKNLTGTVDLTCHKGMFSTYYERVAINNAYMLKESTSPYPVPVPNAEGIPEDKPKQSLQETIDKYGKWALVGLALIAVIKVVPGRK